MANQAVSVVLALVFVVLTIAGAKLYSHLRHRSAVLENLFLHSPPGAVLDAGLRVVRVNPAFTRLFGYSYSEACGQLLKDLIVPADQESAFELSASVSDERIETEAVRRRKDGSRVHVLVANVPVRGPEGKLSICALYRDITQSYETRARLEALSLRLLEVQEQERRHIARELHDEVGQSLTVLRMLLGAPEILSADSLKARMEQARSSVDELISRVRGLSFDLRPADLDQLGLIPALFSLFDRFTTQTPLLVSFKHQEIHGRFPFRVETAAYRIVQEALTNVVRHAGVAGVSVRLWLESGRLHLQVEDRGAGFDAAAVLQTPKSSGLAGMQERTLLLGGSMSVDSSPGCGTTIHVALPLDVPENHA